MSFLVNIFSKLIIRRLAYFVAPFLLGWISQAWWVQDALKTWGLHPDNLNEFTGEIILGLTLGLAALNEFIAWYRKQEHKSIADDFDKLMKALSESGKLEETVNAMEVGLSKAAASIAQKHQVYDAKVRAIADVKKDIV